MLGPTMVALLPWITTENLPDIGLLKGRPEGQEVAGSVAGLK